MLYNSGMDAREARVLFHQGDLTADQLLDLLDQWEGKIRRLEPELDRLRKRLAQYEPEIARETTRAERPSDNATQ